MGRNAVSSLLIGGSEGGGYNFQPCHFFWASLENKTIASLEAKTKKQIKDREYGKDTLENPASWGNHLQLVVASGN